MNIFSYKKQFMYNYNSSGSKTKKNYLKSDITNHHKALM